MYDVRPILDLARDRAPTLGNGRLICVDGPAGSGKTTVGELLHDTSADSTLLHADDLLQGWRGLPGLPTTLREALEPLAENRPSRWRRWDWLASDWAEWNDLPPTPLLIVEGVGTGAPVLAHWTTVLVWVEAPADIRLARGLARDGEEMRPQWLTWLDDERAVHAADDTRDRADARIDGVSGALTWASGPR